MTIVIVSDNEANGWLKPVSSNAIALLRRLISADALGINAKSLSRDERHALRDIEATLGIRLHRTRKPGFLVLAQTVAVCDQRTFMEAA